MARTFEIARVRVQRTTTHLVGWRLNGATVSCQNALRRFIDSFE
jgi:hypothetical protein